jgi:tetratricopeptide (TPR) repeat protein
MQRLGTTQQVIAVPRTAASARSSSRFPSASSAPTAVVIAARSFVLISDSESTSVPIMDNITDDIIQLARMAVWPRWKSEGSKSDACLLLAQSLQLRLGQPPDEMAHVKPDALAVPNQCSPNTRAWNYGQSAVSLHATGKQNDLAEAINLQRQAVALYHESDPNYAAYCQILCDYLRELYEQTGDGSLLTEALDLGRKAQSLRPEGYSEWPGSYGNLAITLKRMYNHFGDINHLNEAVSLQREAVALCSAGHPDRVMVCGNLAISLKILYKMIGDDRLINEAIDLHREALALRPVGHPGRAKSCGNLATSLKTCYELSGDGVLLDGIIRLERESLSLRPTEHPDRYTSAGNLASSLHMRYTRARDFSDLRQSVELGRETLALCTKGHFYRATACINLAASLMSRYERTRENHFLDEAFHLEREALSLRRADHPNHALACEGVVNSLVIYYQLSRNERFLDEAIELRSRALALRPAGHPYRYHACINLAKLLETVYRCTSKGHRDILQQIFALAREAVTITPTYMMWTPLCTLSWVHLQNGSLYDVSEAILCLSRSLENELHDIFRAVSILQNCMADMWDHNIDDKHAKLAKVYQRFVGLLPLLANPALDLQLQLQALIDCSHLGSDAFVNAVLAGDLSSGLETLDLAQGVIWSQTLHRRDPQLEDIPEPLASRLQKLLQAIATKSAAELPSDGAAARTPHDAMHANSSQMYALLREIRALPGLDRFMLGETFENLRMVASDHPVVILVGARGYFYAFMMAAPFTAGHMVIPLSLSEEDFNNMLFASSTTRSHRSTVAPEEMPEEADRAQFKTTPRSCSGPRDGQLKTLWHKVVKPVLDQLGLQVSKLNTSQVRCVLTRIAAVAR